MFAHLHDLIFSKILSYEPKSSVYFDDEMNGYEYEHYISSIFEGAGYDARVTQGSGDQGADVIAISPSGLKFAVQCKKYSTPVGNKAVQEAYAAQKYIDAHVAIVVTNSTFTKSAKELSNTTEVILLHHEELASFLEDMESEEKK